MKTQKEALDEDIEGLRVKINEKDSTIQELKEMNELLNGKIKESIEEKE